MPLTIVRSDITKLSVDAIVNAANTWLQMGAGVCGAIFYAAGEDKLQRACDELAPIKTGEAVITPGFDLPAKYIIHAAGPVYHDGKHGEEALLRSCYVNSLGLAVENGCASIAFPLISSGIYGYPKTEALRVATDAIREFITEHDIEVVLAVFDKASFAVSEDLLGEVRGYIDRHYIDDKRVERRTRPEPMPRATATPMSAPAARMDAIRYDLKPASLEMEVAEAGGADSAYYAGVAAEAREASLDYYVGRLDEPFSATLMRLIDATGKKDSEVYRRANIDRRLFSKIRSNCDYVPSKSTVLAFAVALELSLNQTADLLGRAGFALSPSRKFDVIVEYFIKSRKYDIFQINEVLFSYDQPLLGGN